MRARTIKPKRTGQVGQVWFFWDRFWGRGQSRFCRAHCDRDRRRRIAAYAREETDARPWIALGEDEIFAA